MRPAGAVAEEADRVERLARPARRDEDALARERARRPPEELAAARDDRLRLGHPARADLALGELAALGADELDAPRAQRLDVRLRRRVLPHAHVHRGRDEDRAAEGERGLGQDVVGEAVRELRERVRRERRDDEQVGLRAGADRARAARSRRASASNVSRGDEPLGAGRQERARPRGPSRTSRRTSSHAL